MDTTKFTIEIRNIEVDPKSFYNEAKDSYKNKIMEREEKAFAAFEKELIPTLKNKIMEYIKYYNKSMTHRYLVDKNIDTCNAIKNNPELFIKRIMDEIGDGFLVKIIEGKTYANGPYLEFEIIWELEETPNTFYKDLYDKNNEIIFKYSKYNNENILKIIDFMEFDKIKSRIKEGNFNDRKAVFEIPIACILDEEVFDILVKENLGKEFSIEILKRKGNNYLVIKW